MPRNSGPFCLHTLMMRNRFRVVVIPPPLPVAMTQGFWNASTEQAAVRLSGATENNKEASILSDAEDGGIIVPITVTKSYRATSG